MQDVTNLIGVLVLFCGIYCLYAAFQMKVRGEINTSLLLTKELMYKTCKDKEAYIQEMFPTLLIFAVATTLCGALDVINSYVVEVSIPYFISLGVFLITFVLFVTKSSILRKKYY